MPLIIPHFNFFKTIIICYLQFIHNFCDFTKKAIAKVYNYLNILLNLHKKDSLLISVYYIIPYFTAKFTIYIIINIQ